MGCGASTPSQAVQHGSPMQAKDTATSWELVRCSPSGHELFQKHGIPPEIAKEFVDKLGFRKTQHLNLVVEEDIKKPQTRANFCLLALRLARQHAPDFLAVIQMAAAEATTAPKMLELVLRSTTWHLESLLLDVGGVLTPAFYETWSSMETAANDLQAPCLANFYSMLAGEAAHLQALELRTKVLGA
ncbi:hypothetical protein Agub_g2860, partial [Astrephomene gubernaculifera]